MVRLSYLLSLVLCWFLLPRSWSETLLIGMHRYHLVAFLDTLGIDRRQDDFWRVRGWGGFSS